MTPFRAFPVLIYTLSGHLCAGACVGTLCVTPVHHTGASLALGIEHMARGDTQCVLLCYTPNTLYKTYGLLEVLWYPTLGTLDPMLDPLVQVCGGCVGLLHYVATACNPIIP